MYQIRSTSIVVWSFLCHRFLCFAIFVPWFLLTSFQSDYHFVCGAFNSFGGYNIAPTKAKIMKSKKDNTQISANGHDGDDGMNSNQPVRRRSVRVKQTSTPRIKNAIKQNANEQPTKVSSKRKRQATDTMKSSTNNAKLRSENEQSTKVSSKRKRKAPEPPTTEHDKQRSASKPTKKIRTSIKKDEVDKNKEQATSASNSTKTKSKSKKTDKVVPNDEQSASVLMTTKTTRKSKKGEKVDPNDDQGTLASNTTKKSRQLKKSDKVNPNKKQSATVSKTNTKRGKSKQIDIVDQTEEQSTSVSKTTKNRRKSVKSDKVDPKVEEQSEPFETTIETSTKSFHPSLPRTLELKLRQKESNPYRYVIGIDEAGRGPLAGPVVAAAVILPDAHSDRIQGIVDSKLITNEDTREDLYNEIIAIPNIIYAVAIINAKTIDQINILQATLFGMKSAATAVMGLHQQGKPKTVEDENDENEPVVKYYEQYDASQPESYVVVGNGQENITSKKKLEQLKPHECYALIDGNKVPKNMPCTAEAVIKGDGKEYIIAVASILAKVTRDRLMHQYDTMYPQYNFQQHKGYPTLAHRNAITQHGISPIHRRTFAPIKHMKFDS